MPRYKLTIEYDGRPFVGWQVQDNGISVQGVLTAAVAAFCGETVHVQGAGRTDAGVHALGQVAHVDLTKAWDADTVRDALNACLRPHPVAVLAAEPAAEDFDARFSAMKRHYLYRIVNRRADLALDVGRALRVPRPLDADAMHAAAQRLVGRHDFTTFRAAECQAKSPEKTLDQLDVERHGEELQRPRLGALVPAPPGALDGGLAHPRRRRPLERRRSRRRPRRPRPQGLRPGRAAGWAVFGAGGLLTASVSMSATAGFTIIGVIAGLGPATPLTRARRFHIARFGIAVPYYRGSRDKPGYDGVGECLIRNTDPKSSGRSPSAPRGQPSRRARRCRAWCG